MFLSYHSVFTTKQNMLKIRSKLLNSRTLDKNAKMINFFTRNVSSSQNILHSNLPEIIIPESSLDEFVISNFDKFHNFISAECGVTGRKYTFEDVRVKSRNLNRHLRKNLKLEKGDVLAILLPNVPEFGLVTLGALKAGLVVTTINPLYTPEEISRQLTDSSAKVIVTLSESFSVAKAATNFLKINLPILAIKTEVGAPTPSGALKLDEFLENIDFPDVPPASCEETALLPYSSGTTGLPKGVKLSHKNIIANILQVNTASFGILEDTTPTHQDVAPAVIPKFHIYGLATDLNLTFKGGKAVTLPKFVPEQYVKTLRIHKPNILFVAPPLVLFLANHPMTKAEDLQSLRVVFSAAAPLGALDEERFLQKAQKQIRIHQAYGLTETAPILTLSRKEKMEENRGSVGKMFPSTIGKIVNPNDPDFTPLGANQTGELLVKGPQIMKEYLNRPEESRTSFTEDGWFRTGDLLYYNENEVLFVKDRLKELIKVKGYQVPPAELEEIIRDFPDVEDAAVIGVPHERHGECPRAYIVKKRDKTLDLNKLNEFVNEKVADYKQLIGGIEIVESIPKNASGKILRRSLKLQYEASN